MTECPVCDELLAQYIQAGNDVIDRKKQLQASPKRPKAATLVATALRRRTHYSRTLRQHRQQHGSS